MKKIKFLLFALFISILSGCSNPNAIFIDTIKEKLKRDAMGIELNYKNIMFQWVDTLFVHERLSLLDSIYNQTINDLLNTEFFVHDNLERGKIFSLEYISIDRLTELRNFQKNVRSNMYPRGGHNDYYEYLFDENDKNYCRTDWCNELRSRLQSIDNLISNYEQLKEGDLTLLENVIWHYERIDSYENNQKPNPIWQNAFDVVNSLVEIKSQIDSLSTIDPHSVIHYKALNRYKINNPLLGGVEQEFARYFIFSSDFEIIEYQDI